MDQTVTTATSKGVVIGLLVVITALAMYFLNVPQKSPLQYVGYIVFIGGIIWAISSYGKQIDYNATFGNYFSHGFKVAAMVTVIMVIFMAVFLYVFPDFKENAIDMARAEMAKGGKLSAEQQSQALEMTRKFFTAFAIGGTLLGYMFFGTLAALIGAAITKKNPRPIDMNDNQTM